jgi:hypothetical protein
MATPTRSLRLRPRLRTEIERIAKRTRRSFSEVTQDLLEEAVRIRECPGVHFTDEPAGCEAKVTDEIDALTSENEAFHETGLRRE